MNEALPNYPEACWKDGLTCRSCVGHAARSMAVVCPGLSAEEAGRMFDRMYAHPACRVNQHDFQWAYLEADGQVNPLVSKKVIPFVQITAA